MSKFPACHRTVDFNLPYLTSSDHSGSLVEQLSCTDVAKGIYNHQDTCSTFNLYEEQYANEFIQKNMSSTAETGDSRELITYLGGVPKSLHYMNKKTSAFVDISDIQFQNADVDMFQELEHIDDSEQIDDSEDEMLTVHFEQQDNVENEFVCQVCHRSYNNLHLLEQHELTHFEDNQYKCSLCSFVTINRHSLQSHYFEHTYQRSYKCNLCDFSGSRPYRLKRHMQLHTNEAPHKCSLCQYSTTTPRSLDFHYKNHHLHKTDDTISISSEEETREQQTICFSCKYCLYTCDTYKNFENHLQKHSESSDLLQKNVSQMSNLKAHTYKHSDSHNMNNSSFFQSSYLEYLQEHKTNDLKKGIKDKLSLSKPYHDTSITSQSHTRINSQSNTSIHCVSHASTSNQTHTSINNQSHTSISGVSHTSTNSESHTSISGVSHKNKMNRTKSGSTKSFQDGTRIIHSQLHHSQRILSKNVSCNHPDNKLKMRVLSESFKLNKSSRTEVQISTSLPTRDSSQTHAVPGQTGRTESDDQKLTVHEEVTKNNPQSNKGKWKSILKTNDPVHSPVKTNKEISYKHSSFVMRGNVVQMLTSEQQHKCNVCEFCGASINSLKLHPNLQTKVTTCDKCQNMCGNLKVYMVSYSPLVVQAYKCTVCEYSCKIQETLNRHIAEHHVANKQSKESNQEGQSKNWKNLDTPDANGVSPNVTTRQTSQMSSQAEEKVCNNKKAILYRCVVCQFKSKSKLSMKKHLLKCDQTLGLL